MTQSDIPGSTGEDNESVERQRHRGVVIEVLEHPPERGERDNARVSLVLLASRGNHEDARIPDWVPRDLTDSSDSMRYVRMNSCGQAEMFTPGYLGTSNLNGCVAVGAYEQNSSSAGNSRVFLEHYDDMHVRELDDDERLKAGALFEQFVADRPLKVVIAFPKEFHPEPPDGETYDQGDYPVATLIDQCKHLPDGSHVLLIPYETAPDPTDPRVSHVFSVGMGGSYTMGFFWNGHRVGEPEEFSEAQHEMASTDWEARRGEYTEEHDDPELDG